MLNWSLLGLLRRSLSIKVMLWKPWDRFQLRFEAECGKTFSIKSLKWSICVLVQDKLVNILTEHVGPIEKNWEGLTPLAVRVLGDKIVSTGRCRGLWSSFEHFELSAYPLCKNWNKIQKWEDIFVWFSNTFFEDLLGVVVAIEVDKNAHVNGKDC